MLRMSYGYCVMMFCALIIFQGCVDDYQSSFGGNDIVQGYVVGIGSSSGMGKEFVPKETSEQVIAKGYNAQVGSFQMKSGFFFKSVIVGPFPKLEDAIQAMELLRSLAPRQGVETRENIWVNEYYGSIPVRFKRVAYGG